MDSQTDSYTKICVNLYTNDLDVLKEEARIQDRDVSWIIRNVVRKHVSSKGSALA